MGPNRVDGDVDDLTTTPRSLIFRDCDRANTELGEQYGDYGRAGENTES